MGIILITQLCGDSHKPSYGSVLSHRDSMESKRVFFVAKFNPFLPFRTVIP